MICGHELRLGSGVCASGLVSISPNQRSTHLHVVGSTGSGKSKFLEGLIRQDILANRQSGCGLLLVDPHGSLYDSIVAWLAQVRLDRPIIPIDLRRDDWVVAYNLLRKRERADPSVIVDSIVDAIAHVWGSPNTDETPRFARWIGNILRVLYQRGYTLIEAVHLLTNQNELRRAMTMGMGDAMTQRDWELVDAYNAKDFEAEVSSSVNRLKRFVTNERLRSIFGQPDVSLDLGRALDEGSIILVSLAREGGRVSKENADLFATLLLNDLWMAAQERGKGDHIRPFYVYVDEFQRFITPTIAENLDEARGFGLHLTLAHQFPNQLRNAGDTGTRVYDSVMENARSKVVFSLSMPENLEPMAQWLFRGTMDPDKIKLALHSTKVMSYREEYRTAYSSGRTTSKGGTDHSSYTEGEGDGGSSTTNSEDTTSSDTQAWNSYFANARGSTDSWSESTTEGESESPMLIPVMGQELSSVQFECLDEQLHRAMAVLFDQEQRQCVARLRGMRAPVSLHTPFISATYIRPERIEEYLNSLYQRLPFALRAADAHACVEKRSIDLPKLLLSSAHDSVIEEPATAKRRIR